MHRMTLGLIAYIIVAILALLAFSWAVAATPASAQTLRHCAPRDHVVENLAKKYGETRQSMGLGADNTVMEVFASVGSGSWTITLTMPNGITCLFASGQAFEALPEVLPPEGDAL